MSRSFIARMSNNGEFPPKHSQVTLPRMHDFSMGSPCGSVQIDPRV
jgi:hypothetical protein